MILAIIALAVSVLANIYQLVKDQRLKGVLRSGLRKAEWDRADRVRIPYNQLAELLGWEPEFTGYRNAKTGEDESYQASVYPIKGKK